MQVIVAVVRRKDPRWMAGIADRRVEVDNSVELLRAANPSVDFLPQCFVLGCGKEDGRCPEECALKWRDRSPDRSNTLLMSARDELTITLDHVLGARALRECRERAREEDVVDAENQDHIFDSRLRKHVAIEAREAGLAKHSTVSHQGLFKWPARLPRASMIMQQAIADDAQIQHAQLRLAAAALLQTLGEHVRPAMIGIFLGTVSVSG